MTSQVQENITLRHVISGATLPDQAEHSQENWLLMQGAVLVEVAGRPMAEIGPGEILHDHHRLDIDGHHVALKAKTACVLAVARKDEVTIEDLFRYFAASKTSARLAAQIDGRSR